MSWASLLTSLLGLFSSILSIVNRNGLISEAEKAVLADQLLAEAENVDTGFKARLAQRLRDAGGVSDDDDPFRRD